MGVVSLRDVHPDLKLGLTLAGAVLLLGIGNPGRLLEAHASLKLDLSATSYGWLLMATGVIGGLAVIAAAVWVDRRPPHAMMAGGVLVAVLSLSVLSLPAGLGAYAAGMFIAAVGSSAFGSLIFYAVVVKGAVRYRGAMIGALGMIFYGFSKAPDIADWHIDQSMLIVPVVAAFAMAGAALLFFALPRVFTGAYEPGRTPRAGPGAPGVWRAVIRAAIAYCAASGAVLIADIQLYSLTAQSTSELDAPRLGLLTMPVLHAVSAAGVLLWGAASDFPALRRWLLLAALLFMLAAGAAWAFDSPPAYAVGLLAVALAKGGLLCLPWAVALMAELLPTRHFAKLAFPITYFGVVAGSMMGGLLLTALLEVVPAVFLVLASEALALSVIAALMRRPRAAEEPGNDA